MCPEFAAGEHSDLMAVFLQLSVISVLGDRNIVRLSRAERTEVLQEFARSRRHIS